MQIVAFDFGVKKIGVAVGQTETNTSSPLHVIQNKDNKINWNEITSTKPNTIPYAFWIIITEQIYKYKMPIIFINSSKFFECRQGMVA